MTSGRGRRVPACWLPVLAAVAVACGTGGGVQSGSGQATSETVDTEMVGHDSESWGPLSVLPVIHPGDFGAVGDGLTDDTLALQSALDSLVDGGILRVDADTTYRTTDVVRITNDHVKLWSPSGSGGILADTEGVDRRQAVIVDGASNVGLFGLRFESTADRRLTALEDSAVVLDGAHGSEIVGLEVSNSASVAVMVFGASSMTYVTANNIHHTWADAVHFTDGAHDAWVWNNHFFTEEPWLGDDGIACVTYGSGAPCRRMEWWGNVHLGSDWGRGLAVIGGEDIDIHHNFVQGTGAAGIIVASEPSYETAGSRRITIRNNVIVDVGHAVPHPAILISGLEEPITDVAVADNIVVAATDREVFRAEGDVDNLQHTGTEHHQGLDSAGLDDERADRSPLRARAVMATRDPALVAEQYRPGLYRVHVGAGPDEGELRQRFEYLVTGPRSGLEDWRADLAGVSALFCPDPADTVGDCRLVVRTPEPVELPDYLGPLSFAELRLLAAQQPELWRYVDAV